MSQIKTVISNLNVPNVFLVDITKEQVSVFWLENALLSLINKQIQKLGEKKGVNRWIDVMINFLKICSYQVKVLYMPRDKMIQEKTVSIHTIIQFQWVHLYAQNFKVEPEVEKWTCNGTTGSWRLTDQRCLSLSLTLHPSAHHDPRS